MSAIVAAAGAPLSHETQTWIDQATAFSAHAGPDAHAAHTEMQFGLGLALLRTGQHDCDRPLALVDGTWIAADARLDGRHWEPTHAEQILRAYATAGEAFLEQLAGDFGFALWDPHRAELICARDHFGVAPLHYARVGGELLVASALDALLLHPAVSDELDESAIADFLVSDSYADAAATAFAGIRRVPPAHVLRWRDGQVTLRRYWSQPRWEPLARFKSRAEGVERFKDLLTATVAERVTGDRVGVPLGAGLDSSSIAATAGALMRERGAAPDAVRGVTLALAGPSDEEAAAAAHAARYLEIAVDVVDASAVDPLAEPPVVTPEPTWYRRAELELAMERRLAEHGRIALTGLGGDPLLWFAPWYWVEWAMAGRVLRLGRATGHRMRLFGGRPHPDFVATLRHTRDRALARRRGPTPSWLSRDLVATTRVDQRIAAPTPRAGPRGRAADVRTMSTDPLWPSLFGLADPTFTHTRVRFRHPYFDLRLVRFAASLAPEPWLKDKQILRDAMRGVLPERVRTRAKSPQVGAPLPGQDPAVGTRLAELVRGAPGLDQFVDREALVAAVSATGHGAAAADLRRPLGLAHWLTHRGAQVA